MFYIWRKMEICVPEVVAVGHKCTYGGRYLRTAKFQKIQATWRDCNSLDEVRDFWVVCGIVRFGSKLSPRRTKTSSCSHPGKTQRYWGQEQKDSMGISSRRVLRLLASGPIDLSLRTGGLIWPMGSILHSDRFHHS